MMKISQMFDSVIMLTSSNWFTEPRSNRYHYATRFAKEVPVYFVQFDHGDEEGKVTLEPSGIDNITIVHMSWHLVPSHTSEPPEPDMVATGKAFFEKLGCTRSLVWMYNPYCASFSAALSPLLRVYHATENYLLEEDDFKIGTTDDDAQAILKGKTKQVLALADLTIAVSDGVAEALRASGAATKPIVEVVNGCDAEFWLSTDAWEGDGDTDDITPKVLFQGGINRRLDFDILTEVVLNMADMDFWFVGNEDPAIEAWQLLKKMPNVYYFGTTDSDGIADLARKADLGWVPFIDTKVLRTSLPLKMYEYVACGLPVVSTPINGLLKEDPDLFRFCTEADEYEREIRAMVPTRHDPDILKKRVASARRNGYDKRFEAATAHILNAIGPTHNKKNVLVLYDERHQFVNTIYEHISSFKKYSKNNMFFAPGVIAGSRLDVPDYFPLDLALDLDTGPNGTWNFDHYDVIVIHYSARLSLNGYLNKMIVESVAKSNAHKVLFIQDEYENTNRAIAYMKEMGIDTIFTCVPPEGQRIVYPEADLPDLEFVQTLTGYVPEDRSIETDALPLEDRDIAIAYRGRQLPHHYGELGWDKYRIGERMRDEAAARGINADISNRAEDRIYGSWYAFLGSARATLGTESGANIFDFDGSLAELAAKLADKPYEDVYPKHFEEHDNLVRMNQISPKFFEAIRLRTALICFRGYYSDILHPDVHYIPLEKDFSNLDEVFAKVQDDDYVRTLTERAYADVIESGRYSYKKFVRDFDDWLDETIPTTFREVISAPVAVRYGRKITPIFNDDPRDKVLNTTILGHEWLRADFRDLFVRPEPVEGSDADADAEIAGDEATIIPFEASVPRQPVIMAESRSAEHHRALVSDRHKPKGGLVRKVMPRRVRSWAKTRLIRAAVMKNAPNRPWYYGPMGLAWKAVPRPIRRRISERLK